LQLSAVLPSRRTGHPSHSFGGIIRENGFEFAGSDVLAQPNVMTDVQILMRKGNQIALQDCIQLLHRQKAQLFMSRRRLSDAYEGAIRRCQGNGMSNLR
jgi:hypothetical protein